MGQRPSIEHHRHFAGSNTRFLLKFLRAHARTGAIEEVLSQAGETRSPDELSDDRSWSSYTQFRRLLEAAAVVLGGPQSLIGVGLNAFADVTTPNYTEVLQSLGSPAALYADIAMPGASLSPIVSIRGEEVGPTDWIIEPHFRDRSEPFEEYCCSASGLPFTIDGMDGLELTVTASIGIASSASLSAGELLKDADIPLYRAKVAGKGFIIRFEPSMQAEMIDRLAGERNSGSTHYGGQFGGPPLVPSAAAVGDRSKKRIAAGRGE